MPPAPSDVAQLQSAAGNRATTAWITQPSDSLQRCGEAGCTGQCCEEISTTAEVQRQKDAGAGDAGRDAGAGPVTVAATPVGAVVPFVVRDPSIGLGGTLVADLQALKTALMSRTAGGQWSLMLSIHGSGDKLAAQAPPDWQANAKFYQAADISNLFGDKAFTDWRDQFGPQRVVLVACQVSQRFEQVVSNALTRGGQGLSAGGLGPGCKPIATKKAVEWQAANEQKSSHYSTRAQFNRLSDADKEAFEGMLSQLNQQWGYFGAPPVPATDLLRYYFDEPPKGYWVLVEVNKKDPGSDTLRPLGVPYHNRWSNSTFKQECDPMASP